MLKEDGIASTNGGVVELVALASSGSRSRSTGGSPGSFKRRRPEGGGVATCCTSMVGGQMRRDETEMRLRG